MYHSITFFGDEGMIPFNTWVEWNMAPTTRPVFNPPKFKTQSVDVPTASGSIDLSTSLTGYPLYENRTGTMEFVVLNEYHDQRDLKIPYDWSSIYSDIMRKIHGQYLKATLEDDPDWYYEGRFTVESWKSDKHYSLVTIGYDVSPYKWSVKETVNSFTVTQNDSLGVELRYYRDDLGDSPINPTVTVSGATNGVNIFINTPYLGLMDSKLFLNGTSKAPEFVLYIHPFQGDSRCYLTTTTASGTTSADVSISFRRGKL